MYVYILYRVQMTCTGNACYLVFTFILLKADKLQVRLWYEEESGSTMSNKKTKDTKSSHSWRVQRCRREAVPPTSKRGLQLPFLRPCVVLRDTRRLCSKTSEKKQLLANTTDWETVCLAAVSKDGISRKRRAAQWVFAVILCKIQNRCFSI